MQCVDSLACSLVLVNLFGCDVKNHNTIYKCKQWEYHTTFNGGSLGSCIDEERSEMRYVMWIAEFSESSNLWTHIALQGKCPVAWLFECQIPSSGAQPHTQAHTKKPTNKTHVDTHTRGDAYSVTTIHICLCAALRCVVEGLVGEGSAGGVLG